MDALASSLSHLHWSELKCGWLHLVLATQVINRIKSAWGAQRPWTLALELCFWPLLLALMAFVLCEVILNKFREEPCIES